MPLLSNVTNNIEKPTPWENLFGSDYNLHKIYDMGTVGDHTLRVLKVPGGFIYLFYDKVGTTLGCTCFVPFDGDPE